jgi:hypothetical protein
MSGHVGDSAFAERFEFLASSDDITFSRDRSSTPSLVRLRMWAADAEPRAAVYSNL